MSAFVTPSLFSRHISSRSQFQSTQTVRQRWRSCQKDVQSNVKLNSDELQAATAAIRVSNLLSLGSTNDDAEISTFELFAFCNVKGVSASNNFWDRESILKIAKAYANEERLARISQGDDWESLSSRAKIKLLHKVCNGEGDATYIDPDSGYTVFTFYAHLRRGNCCGLQWPSGTTGVGEYQRTHRCRHCPYTDDGRIMNEKMRGLKKRIPVLEYVREKVQEEWRENDGFSYSSQFSLVGSKESEVSKVVNHQVKKVPMQDGEYARLRKVVKIEMPEGDGPWTCESCRDQQVVTCTRCNGWTFLISPQLTTCPQCEAKGFHPCMNCTSFRPPARKSFYD